MAADGQSSRIYDGDGDQLMVDQQLQERLVILPDAHPFKKPDTNACLRILWGQHMLDDLLAGRYRALVCAVNAEDNSHGIIGQLAHLLPTSQWDAASITKHARQFAHSDSITVIKFDMDQLEVLGLLRPTKHKHLTLPDLSHGFGIAAEMIRRKPQRMPAASVSFLGARANALLDSDGNEPSFESVLREMHQAGFVGDVYPSPWMWESAPTAVYARYPFPESLDQMRQGGF
jgi:hypothetical protein